MCVMQVAFYSLITYSATSMGIMTIAAHQVFMIFRDTQLYAYSLSFLLALEF